MSRILFWVILISLLLSSAQQSAAAETKLAWQIEWEKTIDAARKDGKVVAGVPASAELRKSLEETFAKRFPGTCFHVFPQVINKQADGGEDAMLAREVAAYCERRHGIALDLIEGDFDARTLQQSYARMRYFVATRLHSSIFAASAGVPTIVFGYHGTKAEGIWHDLGFDDLFFDINALHWPEVERSLETLIRQERDISTKLLGRTREWREKITEVVRNELAHFS